jgi:flagellar motility protein MotE (MotC chaperone)
LPPPDQDGEHCYTAAELDVLQSLSKRRDELDRREQGMAQHEALLKAAEIEVDRKITELNKIKGELEALLNKQQAIQGERVESLIKIYEGMKPKEAARIFDTLDMDVLMAVVGKMSERKSSPIIANMDPEKARLVTIKLTEQQKLPNLTAAVKDGKNAPLTP